MLIYQYVYHLQHLSGNPKSCAVNSEITSPVSQRHSIQWGNLPAISPCTLINPSGNQMKNICGVHAM